MITSNITSAQLRRAAGIKDKIHSLEKQLRKLLLPPPVERAPKPMKRKLSASHKRALAAGLRKWAAKQKAK